MIGTLFVDNLVFRQFQSTRLQQFLEPGLGVLERLGIRKCRNTFSHQSLDELARRFDPPVQEYRTDDGFQGIGKNGIPKKTAALELAGAQQNMVAEIQLSCDFSQGTLTHNPRSKAGEIAFRNIGPGNKEQFGHDHVEDRIAEELESFVIWGAAATVGKRQSQKIGLPKLMPQPVHRRRPAFLN